jgi:DNA-directed RNA polymerase subunit RPC12/RpoP
MIAASVYYCWSCDAHRRTDESSSGRAVCPRCGRELASDARLKQPEKTPVRPLGSQPAGHNQLAASA